jgi:hypothetical protein
MEPGLELDALIAEKIMEYSYGEHLGLKRKVWKYPDGVLVGGRDWCYFPPEYSASIEAAWELVDKFNVGEDEMFKIEFYGFRKKYECLISKVGKDGNVYDGTGSSESAAHAICLAALGAAAAL